MRIQINLDEFVPTMDAPDKVYQLFSSLGFKVLDVHLKTNPSVYNLPAKEASLIEKIFAVANYDRRFQILLFKLQSDSPEQSRREAIRTIPEKILREVDFPFIIFTPDFKTYTFTLVEKVREGPGEFKRKLTKLVVDSNQPYHTDKEILRSLVLSADIKNPVEVYKLFQNAFSVERVTKKFFTEYREVFEKLSKEIAKQNKHLKFTLFAREGSVENFTKILLGRLMFLYFIQKRGWLNCYDGWGSGDKKFLYNKFQEAKKDKKNYFKDYLEPLFFDTLNNPRRDKPDQATQFGGRIPFLNGGLFEPNYDYKDPSKIILLDNDSFEHVFSVFEKYNFTVKEDEPLDKEVAIDPEMLGKVFENLLEENLRKGKGTYYTPREIVHYMCHESLINYLASEVGIGQEEIRNFLDREQSSEKKETLSPLIKGKAKEIDEKLADIKVLDPACGSGAFLVGMLHEVINARLSLNRELGRSLSEYELKKATIQNNIYGVDIDPGASEIAKLRLWLTLVVDHNLSEIEPLPNLDYKIMVGNSLLDEFMGVKLFNFEKAKVQTNGKKALKLFEDDIQQVELFEDDNKSGVLKALQKLHALYFKESDPEKKKQIRTQIDRIEFDLIETTVKDEVKKLEDQINYNANIPMLKGMGIPPEIADKISKLSSQQAQILETFNEIKKSNVKPFFLFQLHFSDVFETKGGFDVVIANPPYIGERGHKEIFREIRRGALANFYLRKMDIFYFFFHLALNLGKQNSNIAFITTNYYITASGAKKLRQDFQSRTYIKHLINFNELKLFESAQGQHNMITILSKSDNNSEYENVDSYNCITKRSGFAKPDALHQILSWHDQETEYFDVPQKDLYDGSEMYIRLNGKYNNSNSNIQSILDKMMANYSLGQICFVNMGVQSGADIVGKKLLDRALNLGYINKKYLEENNISIGTPIYVVDQTFVNSLLPKERDIIKPFIKNSDVDRYYIPNKFQHYYIYADSQTDIQDMPSIKKHLLRFRSILKAREQVNDKNNSWFWIRGSKRQFLINTGEHIVCPYRAKLNIFALTDGNIVGAGDVYFIARKDKSILLRYILALLNSKLFYVWLYYKGKRKGEILELYQKPLSEIPIKKISEDEQKPFIEIVDKILAITNSSDYLTNSEKQARVQDYENQIDQLVYKLYGLTPEEIVIVEGKKNEN